MNALGRSQTEFDADETDGANREEESDDLIPHLRHPIREQLPNLLRPSGYPLGNEFVPSGKRSECFPNEASAVRKGGQEAGPEAGQEAEDKGDEEPSNAQKDSNTHGLVHEGRDKDNKDTRKEGQCSTQSLVHFVNDQVANETDSGLQTDPGETPDSKQKGQDTNVANQLEHAVFEVPEIVGRSIDIDLNVFSENVRSGLVETIVMAQEALRDVIASHVRICAKLLKEVQKPVCKTQGPCEFPTRMGTHFV